MPLGGRDPQVLIDRRKAELAAQKQPVAEPAAPAAPAAAPVTPATPEPGPIANLFGAINYSVGDRGDDQAPGRRFADRAVEKGAQLGDVLTSRYKGGEFLNSFTGGGYLQPGGGKDPFYNPAAGASGPLGGPVAGAPVGNPDPTQSPLSAPTQPILQPPTPQQKQREMRRGLYR